MCAVLWCHLNGTPSGKHGSENLHCIDFLLSKNPMFHLDRIASATNFFCEEELSINSKRKLEKLRASI